MGSTTTNQYEYKRRPSNSGLQSSSKMSNLADRQNKLREQRNKYRNSDQDEDEDDYDNNSKRKVEDQVMFGSDSEREIDEMVNARVDQYYEGESSEYGPE